MLALIVTDIQHSVMELTLRHVCLCFLSSHVPVFALGPHVTLCSVLSGALFVLLKL
jgi:hypothetical protein